MSGIFSDLPGDVVETAISIQRRTSETGFDWDDVSGITGKIREELREIEHEIETGNHEGIKEEAGDLIFSVINLCRYLDLDPRQSLDLTNRKFMRRYLYVERRLSHDTAAPGESKLERMERYWEESKLYDE